jgi:CubicO group peptidase (beta-lactamase class C family)
VKRGVAVKSRLLLTAVLVIGVLLLRRFAIRMDAPVRAEAPRFDATTFRERAKVPALAYAAITRERDVVVGATGPATEATTFEAASIAKPIIAIAVMQLVEEGKLALDTDVSTYVGFAVRHPSETVPITLRMLLSHTSSIHDDDITIAPRGVSLDTFLRSCLARPSSFQDASPGTAIEYSNVGPSIAALAVECVSATPFAERAKKRIFEPLGMSKTTFGRPLDPFAPPHAGDTALPPPSHALWPVVDMFSTAQDLARLARAILRDGDAILRPESMRLLLDEGLGFQHRRFGARDVVGHEGEDTGASTGLYVDRKERSAALFLANGDAFHSDDPARAKALQDLLEALFQAAASGIASPDAN